MTESCSRVEDSLTEGIVSVCQEAEGCSAYGLPGWAAPSGGENCFLKCMVAVQSRAGQCVGAELPQARRNPGISASHSDRCRSVKEGARAPVCNDLSSQSSELGKETGYCGTQLAERTRCSASVSSASWQLIELPCCALHIATEIST